MSAARTRLLDTLSREGIADERVLAAIAAVPRDRFVPHSHRHRAWDNRPVPIRDGQTVSQPYVVAFATEALGLRAGDKVLEIGTGSGYQAAVLAELGVSVYSVEIRPALATIGRENLDSSGYQRVHTRLGDGHRGWPEQAPFDAILLSAAPDSVPPALLDQLVEGGRLVGPVGSGRQDLVRMTKRGGAWARERLLGVLFVPMIKAD